MKPVIIQIDEHKDNPLRQIARPIRKDEFGSAYLKTLIQSMQKALSQEHDGVAIAAPQVGESVRVFVVSPNAYEETAKWKPLVFINPVITKLSKKHKDMQEGCLSVRWIYGTTSRAVSATVEAYDELGNKFSFGASGLIAHIFQHEIDHLDGILFIDHGYNLEEFTEEEVKASSHKK
ncbi:MAG: peptide deformylase [Candidatus Pacebacteria bacterium]|nr:peptide deformylase [Candidatus Paceibacterota bacterium]